MNKVKRTFGFVFAHPLAKRHKVRSIFRLMSWQLQCLFYPKSLFVKSFIGPLQVFARRGLTGITGNIYAGLHEFEDMALLLHLLRPGDWFFDIGANVGAYTLLASGVRRAASVAIEPVESTSHLLNRNVDLNGLESLVHVILAAAGAVKGELSFTSGEDTTNHVIADNELVETGAIIVPVITVDSLLAKGLPVLIKIDVEGFETEVIRGMEKTLDEPSLKAVIIELNGSGARYGYDEREIHFKLISKGFRPQRYDPFHRLLTEITYFGQMNTIYCRDLDFIRQRLESSEKIRVMGEHI